MSELERNKMDNFEKVKEKYFNDAKFHNLVSWIEKLMEEFDLDDIKKALDFAIERAEYRRNVELHEAIMGPASKNRIA
jgi:ABC-type lipopolysaccharide export system ATPase subunit